MGREVDGRGERPVSVGRGSPEQMRARDARRVQCGRLARLVPQLAYGTRRRRLGRVRVGGLREEDDEEREGDRDPGERAHALPESSRIDPLPHRLSRSDWWTSAVARRGTDRSAGRQRTGPKNGGQGAFRRGPCPAAGSDDLGRRALLQPEADGVPKGDPGIRPGARTHLFREVDVAPAGPVSVGHDPGHGARRGGA